MVLAKGISTRGELHADDLRRQPLQHARAQHRHTQLADRAYLRADIPADLRHAVRAQEDELTATRVRRLVPARIEDRAFG